jgi:transcription-repair coupling factor (superfamily II helicase)
MRWEQFQKLKRTIDKSSKSTAVFGLTDSQKCHMTASVLYPMEYSCLYITSSDTQARRVQEDLAFFYPDRVMLFPEREVMLYSIAARSMDVIEQRLRVLEGLVLNRNMIIVASIEALLSMQTPPSIFYEAIFTLRVGDYIPLTLLTKKLVQMGYERVFTVEGKGQFSIRGGILDVFPLTVDEPYRIEFFGDEIDSIRSFDIVSQRSITKGAEIVISPARELILQGEITKAGRERISKDYTRYIHETNKNRSKNSPLGQKVSYILDKLDEGIYDDSLEGYFPFFYSGGTTFFEYLKSPSLIVLDEPGRIRERCRGHRREFEEHFKDLLQKGEVLPGQSEMVLDYPGFLGKLSGHNLLLLQALPGYHSDFSPKTVYQLTTRSIPSYQGKLQLLAEDIAHWKKHEYSAILLTGSSSRGEGLVSSLKDHGVEVVFQNEMPENLYPGQVVALPGTLSKGFEYYDARFAIVSDKEIYGVQKRRVQHKKKARKLDPFTDLKVGDYVVHENHGIGRYLGIETLLVDGQKRDYLHIKYAGTDRLYIPTEQMELIQPYIGMGEGPPRLSKLGGAEWQRTKNKVRKSIHKLAVDLVKLYALRQSIEGYRFSPDTEWQRQFEALFPYEETPDQLQAIEETKRDMESSKVMDRLLCGDVGYGKTEIAIRAAFKAIMNSKQVAVLAPTTILAQQHYNTFVNRFEDFPFAVQVLSRFKSSSEQKVILKALKEGNIDVIIGTHRLLGKDVKFKDLGLLVVDEEQRFGVSHKEVIKDFKKNVDVLTLTATPIPRTLHMSLVGIRDISIIETPPEDRYPVQTYVVEYNHSLIRDAILREIQRGGQVYFVYNRVKSIDFMAQRLRELVPEAKIGMAHGQMSENLLERVMMDFYQHKFDLLLCSSIIENGLDIPNVNTIIIYDSDYFGLSQLYQLRGRVGRSNRLAYAYFTYRKDKIISEQAQKRLQAIKQFTEFGSGFKIAMRDLEIRGAGNILGAEQHGHMAAIGYELYYKLLDDAVRTMKGEEFIQPLETTINIKVNAHIGEGYIPEENHKIELYKKIAAINGLEDRNDVEEELEDRFGDIPLSVKNLIDIAYVKALARELKITEITHRDKEVKFKFADERVIEPRKLMVILNENRGRLRFMSSPFPRLLLKLNDSLPNTALRSTKEIMETIVHQLS